MHCSKKLVPLKRRSKIHAEKAEPGVNWRQEEEEEEEGNDEGGRWPWLDSSFSHEGELSMKDPTGETQHRARAASWELCLGPPRDLGV